MATIPLKHQKKFHTHTVPLVMTKNEKDSLVIVSIHNNQSVNDPWDKLFLQGENVPCFFLLNKRILFGGMIHLPRQKDITRTHRILVKKHTY